jgi:hypothetical protein
MKSHIPVLAVCVALLCGCASPWEKNYRPNPIYQDKHFAPTSSVSVRPVEYARVQRYVEQERAFLTASNISPADYNAEQRLAARKRLLEALQISEPPQDLFVLGWSEFTDTERLDPFSKDLRKFAEGAGADIVVVTSVYQGPVTTVVSQPVTTYAHGYGYGGARWGPYGPYGPAGYTDMSTTWVPMPVTEQQYFYQAFFLRRQNNP